jgi:Resolvase, N terminal domain
VQKSRFLLAFRDANSEGVHLGQVAIYCRVSTDDQCCERQERDLKAFARRSGHKTVAVFKETASGADDDRPERKKVMALARAREIEAILVTELFPLGSLDPGSGADPRRPTWLEGQRAGPERPELRLIDLDREAHADHHGGLSGV